MKLFKKKKQIEEVVDSTTSPSSPVIGAEGLDQVTPKNIGTLDMVQVCACHSVNFPR